MARATQPLALLFGFLSILLVVIATPIPTTGQNLSPREVISCDDDPVSCNRPPDASIYICENADWQQPCHLFKLDTINDATYGWGSAPPLWPDGTWVVGSWGPSPGIYVTLFNMDSSNSSKPADPEYMYPGTPDLDSYWQENIYSFVASWDPRVDPATLPQTATTSVAPGPTEAASGSGKRRGEAQADDGRPWWA